MPLGVGEGLNAAPSRSWDCRELIPGQFLELCLVLVKPLINNYCPSLKLDVHTGFLMLPKQITTPLMV